MTPNDPMRQICEKARIRPFDRTNIGELALLELVLEECKKRARDFSYHLFLSNSLGTLVNGGERHLYRSNWRAAFPVLSVLRLGGSQRIFFQSHKDCAAPPKEENLTNTLQRSKPALFRLN